jgi:long-chain acyl-CoA synthetase
MQRTVLRMLDEAAKAFGGAPYALKKPDSGYKALSYQEAASQAKALGAWLIARGFMKGDRTAILAEGCPEWIVAEFGLLSAGCISVPLSIKLLKEEIPFRLEHSGSKAIFTTHNQLEKVLGSLGLAKDASLFIGYLDDDLETAQAMAKSAGIEEERVIAFASMLEEGYRLLKDEAGSVARELAARRSGASEADPVTISYTSGTTGNPKGIILTNLNYWSNCHDAVVHFGIPNGWRTLLVLPVDHSFAHTCGLYTSLLIAMELWFVDARGGGIATLRNIPINLLEAQPHLLFTVPALSGNFMKKIIAGVEEKGGLIEKIFKAGIEAGIACNGNGFNKPSFAVRAANFLPWWFARTLVFSAVRKKVFGPSIRYCVGGGALLDVKQQEFFAALGMPVYQGYGLTEAAPIISSNTPTRHKYGSSGTILPNLECTLRKADGSLVGPGETGEIVIRGDNVMKGYWKNPEATAAALREGWLWTGDRARWDEDGFLVVVGREKALLIAEDGEKCSPEEIEEAVTFSTNLIDQIMVWCDQKKYVSAFVTLDESRVRRMVSERGIKDVSALVAALQKEFFRFRNDPKAIKVQPFWIPKAFHIMPETWSDQDGTVNSTMKIVRHRIVDIYRERIDYAYSSEGGTTDNPRNREILRKIFKLP